MKYVPSLSPPATAATDRWAINGLSRVKPVKAVQERTLPPLVSQPHHAQPESPAVQVEKIEKRHTDTYQEDRRTYCRRVAHLPILEEFRSGVDRRRHNLRAGDTMDHIDEKV